MITIGHIAVIAALAASFIFIANSEYRDYKSKKAEDKKR